MRLLMLLLVPVAACQAAAPAKDPSNLAALAGSYTCHVYCPAGGEGKVAKIFVEGDKVIMINEGGARSELSSAPGGKFNADAWNVAAEPSSDGREVRFDNGTILRRVQ